MNIMINVSHLLPKVLIHLDLQKGLEKDQIVSILSPAGHTASVTMTELCLYSGSASIDDTKWKSMAVFQYNYLWTQKFEFITIARCHKIFVFYSLH